ncbi:MAG: tetratricopeptide repeat protein, partial [Planctomycetaceae bacterium]|nr:tetratricopeptide repeat protein [Planctomycetaceae bacterium]
DNGWSGLQTILTPEWKYIRTADPELYHRPDDVAELDDRADVEVEQLQQMDQALLDFLASLTPRKIDLANLSSRDVRVLSSLGYTAGQSSLQPPDDTSGPDIKVMVPHFNRVVDATHLMEAGRFSEAEPLLREAVEAVPDYLAALGTLGRCLAQQGQIDEAREWYRRVLEKSPEDTSALLNLATADLAQQRPEDARKVLQKLLEIDPSSADANFYLAQASLHAGDAEQARRDFDRAIACDPEHVESFSSLGDLHFERGELDRALPYYEAAIRLDPYSPGPFINRGIALGQMSRLNEAIACFQDGLKFSPDDPLLHSNLGFAFQQSGYLKEAIEHYNATMSVAPDEPLASVNLPMLLSAAPDAKLRDGPRAVEIAARAVKASRGASPEAYDALAAAYAETGRFEEATTAIETALRSPNLETTQFQDMRRRADLYRSHTPYRLAP